MFFVLILGLRLQSYSTNTKRYPPKKVFGNSEFCSFRQNYSSLNYKAYCRPTFPPKKVFGNSEFCSSCQNYSRPYSLENCSFGGKSKTQSFQKLFSGGYLFVFVEYLRNRNPKIKTKNIKNYSSILATANHRNWLDDSPPLMGCPVGVQFYPTDKIKWAPCGQPTFPPT